tara:strand:+ start:1052 stop:1243 length:192 start_codon:yes stop_codon:yes gene_type:complete
MPKVGDKDFPYTVSGIKAAKEEAKRTGFRFGGKVSGKRRKISYVKGGKVEMYQDQLRRKYHGK